MFNDDRYGVPCRNELIFVAMESHGSQEFNKGSRDVAKKLGPENSPDF